MRGRRPPAGDRSRQRRQPASRRRGMTPEDLLRLHFVSDAQIAPDASAIVFVKKHIEKNEYVSNLWLVDTAGGKPRQFTGGGKDSGPRWSPDGRRLAFIGERQKHKPQIYTIPTQGGDGGEAAPLTAFPAGSIRSFKYSPDGKRLAVAFRALDALYSEEAVKERQEKNLSQPPRVIDDWWYRLDGDGYFNAQRYELYLVETASGKHRRVFSADPLGSFSFDFSPDASELVIAANLSPQALVERWKDDLFRLDLERGRLKKILNLPPGTKMNPLWSKDGKAVAYAGRVDETGALSTANLELFLCDPARGAARSLTGKEDFCLHSATISDLEEVGHATNFRWSPDGRRIFMSLCWHGETHIASVAPGGPITFHTAGARQHDLGNFAAGGKLLGMTVSSAPRPREVCLGRLQKGTIKVERLTDFNGPLLAELQIVEPRSRWVRSADGTRVQVWSMRPVGLKPGRKAPAVLEVHGGPHAQYGETFFHEFQVLAASGYAVFFSNPRGSKGYGRSHCEAIRGKWGEADWEDIQAVARFMAEHPDVDQGRVGIMGGSYGGYMTNWAIGHSEMFAAAITDRCVSNLVSMLGTTDIPDKPDHYWQGNTWDRPEILWEQSPLKYLGQARTPLLIIHSEGDLRCSIEQAEQAFTALRHRGVPCRLVRYPSCSSHGMSRCGPPDLRIHRLHQILQWWETHLRRARG